MKNIRRPNMEPCKIPMAMQPVKERIGNEKEVELGYTKEQAMTEAERCLNCPERYCAAHCPAQTAIPEFVEAIRLEDFTQAYEIISRTNPLADISSRVCPYECQCESHCTRSIKNEPVAIGRLERFVCDWHSTHEDDIHTPVEQQDRTVAVVGSGPAGLNCALSLAKAGIKVTVMEKEKYIGGVMAWGIPSFVLPKNLLEKLIKELRSYNVTFELEKELGKDMALTDLQSKYDAVFLATGAARPVNLSAEGVQSDGVLQAIDYLAAEKKPAAKRVTVFGGGNTAIDAARAALRSGAEQVQLVYRRTESEIPANQKDISLAKEEGVEFITLTGPVKFITENGTLIAVECERMVLTAPDYPGGRKNVEPSGEKVVFETDLAVLALGFRNEKVDDLELDNQNRIIVDKQYLTNIDNVYAGGDAATGPATLMKAAAAGKDAAMAIMNQFK